MPHKIMPYLLPVSSIIALAFLFIFARPAITGFFIAQPNAVLNAEIKITAQEVLPENAGIHVFLEKDGSIAKEISVSSVGEFVNKFSQSGLVYKYGSNHELDYEGFGYLGSNIFNINIDTNGLKSGRYTLKTKIAWQGRIISKTEQEVEI